MLCDWWYIKSIIDHEVLNSNKTVNLRASLINKKCALLLQRKNKGWKMHRKQFALNMKVLPEAFNSPNLFRSLQHFLGGKLYTNYVKVKQDRHVLLP